MARIDLKEAQSQLPDLVTRAAQGEEIVIVEDDQPRVQLVAVQEPAFARMIERGLEDVDQGRTVTHQAVEREVESWGSPKT